MPPVVLARADDAGREHLRVVENEQVAGIEQIGQVAEGAVFESTRLAADDEQPRLIAPVRRVLCDQVLGQVVVEEGHGRGQETGDRRQSAGVSDPCFLSPDH